MIAPMTDGCNTMEGWVSGVKRLAETVHQLKDLGSCNNHHLSNAAKAGIEAFDEDINEILVNIYFDIGGAKGKGLKKKREFEMIAKDKHWKLKALSKFGTTTFRSYRVCIEPVTFNWETIFDYWFNQQDDNQSWNRFLLIKNSTAFLNSSLLWLIRKISTMR